MAFSDKHIDDGCDIEQGASNVPAMSSLPFSYGESQMSCDYDDHLDPNTLTQEGGPDHEDRTLPVSYETKPDATELRRAWASRDVESFLELSRGWRDSPLPSGVCDETSHEGMTPLMMCCWRDELVDGVEQLLALGADPTKTTPQGHTAWQYAVAGGSAGAVRALCSYGVSPSTLVSNGTQSACQLAARAGHDEVIRTLLEFGAAPDFTTPMDPLPPLLWALRKEHPRCALILLEAGADPGRSERVCHIEDGLARTPCFYAAAHVTGPLGADLVRRLVSSGCDVNSNCCRFSGMTPMRLAMFVAVAQMVRGVDDDDRTRWSIECLTALVEAGARMDVGCGKDIGELETLPGVEGLPAGTETWCRSYEMCREVMRQSPLELALKHGHSHLLRLMLKFNPALTTPDLSSPVSKSLLVAAVQNYHGAAKGRLEACVQAILEATPDQLNDSKMYTRVRQERYAALACAVQKDLTGVARFLIRSGLNINHETPANSGGTVLHIACGRGSVEMVQMLIDEGADTCILRQVGSPSCLEGAAKRGHVGVVRLLLSRGPDLLRISGCRALHTAVSGNHLEVVKALVEVGVPVDVPFKTANGLTPLYTAALKNYLDIARLLLDSGARVNKPVICRLNSTPLHVAITMNHVAMTRLLLSRPDVDVTREDANGRSPLDRAARCNHAEACSLLVNEGGANVNAIDDNGSTSLHHAAAKGNVEAVRSLVALGADANRRQWTNGVSPLRLACAVDYNAVPFRARETIRSLLLLGADPTLPTANEKSLLDLDDSMGAVMFLKAEVERLKGSALTGAAIAKRCASLRVTCIPSRMTLAMIHRRMTKQSRASSRRESFEQLGYFESLPADIVNHISSFINAGPGTREASVSAAAIFSMGMDIDSMDECNDNGMPLSLSQNEIPLDRIRSKKRLQAEEDLKDRDIHKRIRLDKSGCVNELVEMK